MIASIFYIFSSLLFIIGIKLLGKANTARLGNALSAVGMLIAVTTTLLERDIGNFLWIAIAAVLGTALGAIMAIKVPMTSMPEMVALFNGFGGFASVLVGWAEGVKQYANVRGQQDSFEVLFAQSAICLTIAIGSITFTGSILAYGKLSQKITGAPIVFKFQKTLSAVLTLLTVVASIQWIITDGHVWLYLAILLSSLLGFLYVMPIGGGDMPVVISLLNSLSGVAACTAGLIVLNKVLIVSGCLVGTSGLILTAIMCKAMNRSLKNVLFGTFGLVKSSKGNVDTREPKSITVEDAYYILEAANSVVFIPGYGLAVAQAQHAVKELANSLINNGADVFYAIHPVAGRMPGHMNVLLAEADVDYDQLIELEQANQQLERTDVAIVVGANDVVNPAAIEDESSPIYGMPIICANKARNVFVLKRGQGKGFSGLENSLFVKPNTSMLYGDAKATITQLVAEFKS